jgi:hypothetical protein
MSVATSTAIAIAAGVGAAGSIGGSLIGGSAAKSAAQTQATAAQTAAAEQAREFNVTQANEAPWLQAGQTSLSSLMSGLQPGGQFSTPYSGTFSAPTEEQAQQTPGYQFSLDQGDLGIERASAASGGAFTGGEAKSLDAFNTGLADQTYQQTFNNALTGFQTQFNTYNTNQANLYNRLASTSGLGQTTATQLGQLGQQAATTEGNDLTSGAAATAGGIVGSANAYTAGLQGLSNNASGYLTLSSLLNGGGLGSPGSGAGWSNVNGVPTLNNGATYNVPAPVDYGTSGADL